MECHNQIKQPIRKDKSGRGNGQNAIFFKMSPSFGKYGPLS